MARTYDGPSVKQGKVVKNETSAAEGDAKKTAGDPPGMADKEKVGEMGKDSGPSKAGADANPAMFGDMAPKHLTERKQMQDRHLKEMGSMHDAHHTEHRDMMKRDGMDGEKGAEARLEMHARHHQARHTMMGNHALEHASMAHRHAMEMRGGGGHEEAKSDGGPKLGKPEKSGDATTPKEVGGGDGPKLGKPEDKGEGGAEGR